jgi:choline dehydrogenase-like flavoprotein
MALTWAAKSALAGTVEYRAGLALAEAIIPGSSRVLPADEATFERAIQVLRDFHPVTAKSFGVGVRALDAAAIAYTGKRFRELQAHKQEELIRRWEGDPGLKTLLAAVSFVFKFVHFDRPEVYGRLGGKLNVVESLDQPRWLSQVHRADAHPDDEVECEVVVVGTGAGGGVVGRELADRGFAVVYVEEGEHHRRNAFNGRSIEAHRRFYRGAFTVGSAPMPIFMGRLVGGSTAINGGTCFRTPPWILERWCDDLGTSEFAPDAMARYFARVEACLHVAPTERRHVGPIADVMTRGCDALGWHHFPVMRNAPGCTGAGFCDFGCQSGARRGTDVAYVPAALEKGALLLTGLRAERVILEAGRAVGVEGIAKNGRTLRVRARTVILAGGAVPTPLLLLKQGLANRSGQVGRNLAVQPSSAFSALFDEAINAKDHVPQGYGCDEFLRDGMLLLTAQADVNFTGMMLPFSGHRLMETLERIDHIASFALLVRDSVANGRVWRDVGGFPAITYNVSQKDASRMHRLMTRAGEMCRAAGAKTLYPLAMSRSILDDAQAFDRFRQATPSPNEILWTSYHPLGTCKMGTDPRTSVVGIDHQVHDVPGLYVVDGSTVPGALGVNPQLTIMAMATRAAEKIGEAIA